MARSYRSCLFYDRDIIRRLAACQPHRNLTSAGFSASRLRKYHDPLCLSSPPREQPDFRGYQYSRSPSFRTGHGVPTAVARPVTVGIGNVPDEWVFSCLWHPSCRQAGLRKVLSISFSRARSSPASVSDNFSSSWHCSSVRYFMPR